MMAEIKPLHMEVVMAVISSHFLRTVLAVHDNLRSGTPYPFFDPACIRYEALRSVLFDGAGPDAPATLYGLTEYAYRKSLKAFRRHGTAGLIGLGSKRLTEELPVEAERMVYVLKTARPWIPATKMAVILQGFGHEIPLPLMRRLYASHGWAAGMKPYGEIDFRSLNLRVIRLRSQLEQPASTDREPFMDGNDRLQVLIEVFRTMGTRGITRRHPGSRVSFEHHRKGFLSLGLLGLAERAGPPFRNSKLGFAEEGRIILSKIQKPEKDEAWYLRILESKRISVDATCLTKIFTRWNAAGFQSRFEGDIGRLLEPEDEGAEGPAERPEDLPEAPPVRLDRGFISYAGTFDRRSVPLANPGVFLFLPYLDRLKLFEKTSSLMDADPDRGYGWFTLLLLNLGRILGGISSASKACRTHEPSLPLMAGLAAMPCKDSLLNGLAGIGGDHLLQLRRHLTRAARELGLIRGERIAFDFQMRDFTGDDVELKNIGKGPSPKRKICFPGFRPHIAWDAGTGAPVSIEFRNGKAGATTTIRRFIRELLQQALGDMSVDHVYLDSEYTAEKVWQFIVDPGKGMGADLTMCIKQNRRVKKLIGSFLESSPSWLFLDEDHTYSEQTFPIPIRQTDQKLQCVLKRKESTGRLRCFGSTLDGLDGRGILREYAVRWTVENGIKDLIQNYCFGNIPGIDPHAVNVHYFIVTLARLLHEMLSRDYEEGRNPDGTKKTIGTLRPEFMTGSNAVISRRGRDLVLLWTDPYPEKKHRALQNLFVRLNEAGRGGYPFLGGLGLRFEIGPPRDKDFGNRLSRAHVEF